MLIFFEGKFFLYRFSRNVINLLIFVFWIIVFLCFLGNVDLLLVLLFCFLIFYFMRIVFEGNYGYGFIVIIESIYYVLYYFFKLNLVYL